MFGDAKITPALLGRLTRNSLEAAIYGVLFSRGRQWRSTLRTLLPDLWIAAHIRKRALTMAWTPGLVMDCARALGPIVHPAPLSWIQRLPWRGLRCVLCLMR